MYTENPEFSTAHKRMTSLSIHPPSCIVHLSGEQLRSTYRLENERLDWLPRLAFWLVSIAHVLLLFADTRNYCFYLVTKSSIHNYHNLYIMYIVCIHQKYIHL